MSFRCCFALIVSLVTAEALAVDERLANDGNVVLQDVPVVADTLLARISSFANTRYASLYTWSADGDALYIGTRFGQTNQIHRIEQPLGARSQLTFFDEPVAGVSRRPGTSTLSFTRDAGGNELSQVFLLDPKTLQATMISDGESRNGQPLWSRDGNTLAYSSTRRTGAANDIWIASAPDFGRPELLLEAPDTFYWWASDFRPEASHQLLIQHYISSIDSRIYLLDRETGALQPLLGDAEAPSRNFSWGFTANGDGFFYTSDRDGEFTQLYRYDLNTGESQALTADLDWDIEAANLSHDRSRLVFTVNVGGYGVPYIMNALSGDYRAVGELPTGQVGGGAFSPDGKRLAFTVERANAPRDVYTVDLAADLTVSNLARWTRSETAGLDAESMVIPERVQYPTFDEVNGKQRQIPAFVYKPAGDGPHPVIISIHGGPEAQFRPRFNATYQLWVQSLGAAVVAPNVRGSSGYGKTYLLADNGFKREDSVKDIGALLEWIAEQPDLDSDRVAVYGGSYGGYMVLASAVHYSDRLAAAVNIVGISNFVTFLQNTQDYRRDARRAEYGDERDDNMRRHLEAISPLNNVERIQVPLLVAQGANDPRVPLSESDQIVDAVRENGQTVWYFNALNEGHGFRKKENRDLFQATTLIFFERYLSESAR